MASSPHHHRPRTRCSSRVPRALEPTPVRLKSLLKTQAKNKIRPVRHPASSTRRIPSSSVVCVSTILLPAARPLIVSARRPYRPRAVLPLALAPTRPRRRAPEPDFLEEEAMCSAPARPPHSSNEAIAAVLDHMRMALALSILSRRVLTLQTLSLPVFMYNLWYQHGLQDERPL